MVRKPTSHRPKHRLHRRSTASRIIVGIVTFLFMIVSAFFLPNPSISAAAEPGAPTAADASPSSTANGQGAPASGKRYATGNFHQNMINMGTPTDTGRGPNMDLPRAGFVGAKGRAPGPNGKSIWVRIDKMGRVEGEEIGEAFEEPLKTARVISASDWRQYEQDWKTVEEDYGDELKVMTLQEYRGRTFKRPDQEVHPWVVKIGNN